jgi:hypothetical protein
MSGTGPLVWYVTPHGYGHAARSCDVLSELHARHPDLPLTLVSRHPEFFLRHRLPSAVRVRPGALDFGLVMRDSITIDFDAGARALETWMAGRPALVRAEAEYLRSERAALVVSDIPSLAFEAAGEAGTPALGVGNFSWSWIYRQYAGRGPVWRHAADACAAGYRRAGGLLRYPFHEPMTDFERIRDVPVVARPGRNRRGEMAAELGLNERARWVLMAFTALDLAPGALARMSEAGGFEFVTVAPLAWPGVRRFTAVDRTRFPFHDVLASCDAVLTKPGHGIVSECAANTKPIVHVDRPDWPEHAVLVRSIARHLRHAPLTLEDLAAGAVAGAVLQALSAPPPPEPPPLDGAGLVANLIARCAREGSVQALDGNG